MYQITTMYAHMTNKEGVGDQQHYIQGKKKNNFSKPEKQVYWNMTQ